MEGGGGGGEGEGSGTGTNYTAGQDFNVMAGLATPAMVSGRFKIGAGSDVDTYVVEPGLLVNLAEFTITVPLLGVSDPAAWIGAGSTINVTGKATTTACTVKKVGSRALFTLQRVT